MTTHIGKIGRLSKDCREELGRRIEDGKTGKEIVDWLNGLPEVQAVLREKFEGHPINEQNVSAWRQSGHVEWLRLQSAQVCARQLVGEGDDLTEATRERSLGDCLAAVLAVEMRGLAGALLSPEVDAEKRWERLRELNREVSRLRRDDDRALHRVIHLERWDRELEREAEAEERRWKQERKDWQIDLLLEQRNKAGNAEIFGGGEAGREMAERLFRIKCDLPLEKSKGQSPRPKVGEEAQSPMTKVGENIQRSTAEARPANNIQRPRSEAGAKAEGQGESKGQSLKSKVGEEAQSPKPKVGENIQHSTANIQHSGSEAGAKAEGRGESKGQSLKSKVGMEVQGSKAEAGSGGGTPPELAGGDACGTGTGEVSERAADSQESRLIKADQEEKVQDPKSEVQSLGAGGGEGRGIIGRGMKKEEAEARPAVLGNTELEAEARAVPVNSQAGNTGLEAEARPAVPVNSQTGKSALHKEAQSELAGGDAGGTISRPSAPAYVPDPDPKQEAYIQWWLMNRNIKPFDGEELERLYAKIPKESKV